MAVRSIHLRFSARHTRLFINDVGQSTWEEINDGIAGSNYGWPTTEGPTSNPSIRSPIYYYYYYYYYGHGTTNRLAKGATD